MGSANAWGVLGRGIESHRVRFHCMLEYPSIHSHCGFKSHFAASLYRDLDCFALAYGGG